MEKAEFCYWLQGHFEIAEGSAIDAEMAAAISGKLARAEAHPAPAAGAPASFCMWLRGQLDAHRLLGSGGLPAAQAAAIKARLDSVFAHAAAAPGKAKLPKPPAKEGGLYRC